MLLTVKVFTIPIGSSHCVHYSCNQFTHRTVVQSGCPACLSHLPTIAFSKPLVTCRVSTGTLDVVAKPPLYTSLSFSLTKPCLTKDLIMEINYFLFPAGDHFPACFLITLLLGSRTGGLTGSCLFTDLPVSTCPCLNFLTWILLMISSDISLSKS